MDGLLSLVDDKIILPPPTTNVLELTKNAGSAGKDECSNSEDSDDDDDDDDQDNTSTSSNLELWTFRVPVGLSISALEGIEIHLDDDGWQGQFQVGPQETEYQVSAGCSTENETFRVLVPSSNKSRRRIAQDDSDSDSDEDDDNDEKADGSKDRKDEKASMYLYPAPKPFRRHFNVIKAFPKRSEMELAPLHGPEPLDPMRHSYAPVPQRGGLKRRWMPQGVNGLRAITSAEESSASLSTIVSMSAQGTAATNKEKSAQKQSSAKNDGGAMSITDGLKKTDTGAHHTLADDDEDNDTEPSKKRIKGGLPIAGAVNPGEGMSSKEERKAERKAEKKAAKKAEKKLKKNIKKKGEASQEG